MARYVVKADNLSRYTGRDRVAIYAPTYDEAVTEALRLLAGIKRIKPERIEVSRRAQPEKSHWGDEE